MNSSVVYEFEIPDPARPISAEKRRLGPSGELISFIPSPLNSSDVLGRSIEQVMTYVGTYGMGGPGFFGLRFGDDWLVVSVWGASDWILVDSRLVRDWYYAETGRPLPWLDNNRDDLAPYLVGTSITAITVEKHRLEIRFTNGAVLEIDPEPARRAIFPGNKKPRAFLESDDLRRAVFLAPTAEIWV